MYEYEEEVPDFLSDFLGNLDFEDEEDENLGDIFKPPTLDDYIGQEETKKILSITIKAAQQESRALPNIMISGGFGLGKSILAELALKEFGRNFTIIDGNSANKSPPNKGLAIIDEAHNLTSETQDSLNRYLDSNSLHLVTCTTDPGQLSGAFRSRFRHLRLRSYSLQEIAEIGKKICIRKGVAYTDDLMVFIARRSRSNARQIINYLSTIFDFHAVKGLTVLTREVIIEAFQTLGVDENGYTLRDKEYVQQMPNKRPVGLGWLSAVLGIDRTTIEEEIEPYLLQTGVIDRTPKGRLKLKEI